MFVLKSLGKLILGNSEQKELLKLPSGTFWKIDLDPKDSSKIIARTQYFSDEEGSATLILRRSSVPFSYELIVSVLDSANFENDTQPFKLRAELSFTLCARPNGENLFYWNEPLGPDANSVWEFVFTDKEISAATVEMFQMTVAQCIFETEMKKSLNYATDQEIKKFILTDFETVDKIQNDTINRDILQDKISNRKSTTAASDNNNNNNNNNNIYTATPEKALIVLESNEASFYIFDSSSGLFVPKCPKIIAFILRHATKPWEYSLQIYSNVEQGLKTLLHSQVIDSDATQHLDRASFSFIWCHFTPTGQIWTFSLKFLDLSGVLNFANAYNQSVYESLNHQKWAKVTAEDAKYLLNPMLDVEMTQALPLEFDDTEPETETELDSESESEIDSDQFSRARPSSNSNKEQSIKPSMFKSKQKRNQMLSVGYKSDRSFVARGDSIGIFKAAQDGLEFVTEVKISKGEGIGNDFKLSKMMLHQGDESLLLMDSNADRSVFKMDLDRGEIVEEWKIHDEAKVTAILPNSKYSQMTGEATFIGLNANSIFRVDPRLSGNKRVDSEMKSYAVKNDFSCGATTGAGELAVASAKGEIRLFNKLDKRAKTLLPMFGDPILGVDTTENGNFILATCKTYLLLINTELNDGTGTGFTKSMGSAEDKPIPKRLQLKPEHVAYMGTAPSFTPARFSTGQSEERAIITSSGPYVITWNLRRVKQGHLYDYQIKKYEDEVVADNFRYGQDRSIVVTLPESVTLISKKSLSAPSPKSLRSPRNIINEY